MTGVNRKKFLALGLGAAAGVAAAGCGMGGGSDDAGTTIHLHGLLASAPPGREPNARIDVTVSGSSADLSGSGYSFFASNDAKTMVGSASMWSLQGKVDKDVLTLAGITLIASNQLLPGAPVSVEVDVKTGDCKWSMGPFLSDPSVSSHGGKVTVTTSDIKVRAKGGTPAPPGGGGGM